nr:MAG TPA: hypothetical protein [Caudoviricetes sp.]
MCYNSIVQRESLSANILFFLASLVLRAQQPLKISSSGVVAFFIGLYLF